MENVSRFATPKGIAKSVERAIEKWVWFAKAFLPGPIYVTIRLTDKWVDSRVASSMRLVLRGF